MSRKFAKISAQELQEKINEKFCDKRGRFDLHYMLDVLDNDLKVQFDCENFEMGVGNNGYSDIKCAQILGLHSLDNGLSFWGMSAGGDWEEPVFFIIYWDGKRIRGYVPTDGNTFNTDTMEAYGNGYPEDDERSKDVINKLKRYPELNGLKDEDIEEDFMGWDVDKIINDIKGRIVAC